MSEAWGNAQIVKKLRFHGDQQITKACCVLFAYYITVHKIFIGISILAQHGVHLARCNVLCNGGSYDMEINRIHVFNQGKIYCSQKMNR